MILVPGTNSIYDISVNGEIVFSRDVTKRYPEKGEAEELVDGALVEKTETVSLG